ncbi:hypothetical protein JHN59_11485 [Streptomyces sp. MBT49]|uniref:hypothetical protein n=1 Tax=unclassified Streptomyces TaxID=2593676 RepID=UPI00190D8416|nr:MULTISPECIES: hypothetical protein [unclassified Streptomyces]MBK3625457.1 hypothetical protein [Streptomyces sp. MBT49]MBK3633280.1 hypothetical protein [Streptomyces sp. MBT97]
MPAPVKAPSVGPAAESVAIVAARRADRSEDPTRYLDLVHEVADLLVRGRDLREPSLWSDEPIRIAADIEARAGVRLLRSRRHGPFCTCDACRVRAAVEI